MPTHHDTPPTPREVYDRYQRAVLANAPDEIADLFAADGVLEFPFTLPGMPARVEGREEVRSWLRGRIGRSLRFEEFRRVTVHDTTDPEVIVAEHVIAGTLVATGVAHEISYLYVLRVRHGEIVRLRDYADLVAVGGAAAGATGNVALSRGADVATDAR